METAQLRAERGDGCELAQLLERGAGEGRERQLLGGQGGNTVGNTGPQHQRNPGGRTPAGYLSPNMHRRRQNQAEKERPKQLRMLLQQAGDKTGQGKHTGKNAGEQQQQKVAVE